MNVLPTAAIKQQHSFTACCQKQQQQARENNLVAQVLNHMDGFPQSRATGVTFIHREQTGQKQAANPDKLQLTSHQNLTDSAKRAKKKRLSWMKMSHQHEKDLLTPFFIKLRFCVISLQFCCSSMQKDLLPFTPAPTFSVFTRSE